MLRRAACWLRAAMRCAVLLRLVCVIVTCLQCVDACDAVIVSLVRRVCSVLVHIRFIIVSLSFRFVIISFQSFHYRFVSFRSVSCALLCHAYAYATSCHCLHLAATRCRCIAVAAALSFRFVTYSYVRYDLLPCVCSALLRASVIRDRDPCSVSLHYACCAYCFAVPCRAVTTCRDVT